MTVNYENEPSTVVFLHASEGCLPARKQFFERCYRSIQEIVSSRPNIDVNRRLVTLLMENECLTDETQMSDLQRLCKQAADQWNDIMKKEIEAGQLKLFFQR